MFPISKKLIDRFLHRKRNTLFFRDVPFLGLNAIIARRIKNAISKRDIEKVNLTWKAAHLSQEALTVKILLLEKFSAHAINATRILPSDEFAALLRGIDDYDGLTAIEFCDTICSSFNLDEKKERVFYELFFKNNGRIIDMINVLCEFLKIPAKTVSETPTEEDNATLTPYYTDTLIPIRVGDRVFIDDVGNAVVQSICLPHTEDAKSCACFETGGIMFDTERMGLMLEPFGYYCRVKKIE